MQVAFLGTGLMGKPMAARLIKADYNLTVYNRTISKTESLTELGAKAVKNYKDAISSADVIVTMLTNFSVTEDVLLSDELLDYKNKTIIQMATITPDENLILSQKLNDMGADYIEAPVLGSIPQATEGSLYILVGAEKELAEKWDLFLKVMGNQIIYFGQVGKASAAKLGLNQLIVTLTTAFSMSLGYLREKDVDLEKFMEILRGSALYAPTFDKKLDKMLTRNFENPNFPLKHLLKDVNLITEQFGEANIDVAVMKGIEGILKKSVEDGDADKDYSALYNSVHPKANNKI